MEPTPEAPTAAAPEVAAEESVDIAKIKSMLQLPETATDVELITKLVQLIAVLQSKYDAVLNDAVAMEETLTNRDIADFSDVIDEAAIPLWREQLITNRAPAIAALTGLRAKLKQPDPPTASAAPAPDTRTIPLRNRLAPAPRSVEEVVKPTAAATREDTAVAIRNRATHIFKESGGEISFRSAFERATAEITAPKE